MRTPPINSVEKKSMSKNSNLNSKIKKNFGSMIEMKNSNSYKKFNFKSASKYHLRFPSSPIHNISNKIKIIDIKYPNSTKDEKYSKKKFDSKKFKIKLLPKIEKLNTDSRLSSERKNCDKNNMQSKCITSRKIKNKRRNNSNPLLKETHLFSTIDSTKEYKIDEKYNSKILQLISDCTKSRKNLKSYIKQKKLKKKFNRKPLNNEIIKSLRLNLKKIRKLEKKEKERREMFNI